MNPFLEIPIVLVNNENESKTTMARIKPGEIEYYYPGFNEGTIVVMASGHSIMSMLTFAQMDDAITSWVNFLKKNPNAGFGNLAVKAKEPEQSKLISLKP
jgi:hypothetical protein